LLSQFFTLSSLNYLVQDMSGSCKKKISALFQHPNGYQMVSSLVISASKRISSGTVTSFHTGLLKNIFQNIRDV
jgi:hypothetical protein